MLPRGVGRGQVARRRGAVGHRLHGLAADRRTSRSTRRDAAGRGDGRRAARRRRWPRSPAGWCSGSPRSCAASARASLPMVLDRPVDPARDHIRGPVDAPLTLVEYGDFECPFCGRATGVVRELRERFGDDLRYVFRHLPLTDVHPTPSWPRAPPRPRAPRAASGSCTTCCSPTRTSSSSRTCSATRASSASTSSSFARDLERRAPSPRACAADVAGAEASGAGGTPTFFVGERRHVGAYDAETLIAELTATLRAGLSLAHELAVVLVVEQLLGAARRRSSGARRPRGSGSARRRRARSSPTSGRSSGGPCGRCSPARRARRRACSAARSPRGPRAARPARASRRRSACPWAATSPRSRAGG